MAGGAGWRARVDVSEDAKLEAMRGCDGETRIISVVGNMGPAAGAGAGAKTGAGASELRIRGSAGRGDL